MNRLFQRLILIIYRCVVGNHPYNTCFSYNWTNVRHITRFLKNSRNLIPNKSILADIGSGSSPYYDIFYDRVEKYCAIDFQDSLPRKENRNIVQKEGTIEKLPLSNESIDVALCNQVLEHVINPSLAVAEVARVLKKGSLFVGSVPHASSVHLGEFDYYRFTTYGIKQILESNGFRIEKMETSGGVFSTITLLLFMDTLTEGELSCGNIRKLRAIVFSPLVFLFNVLSVLVDSLRKSNKTPANICWCAVRL